MIRLATTLGVVAAGISATWWTQPMLESPAFRAFVMSPLFAPAVIVATAFTLAAIFLTAAFLPEFSARPTGRTAPGRRSK